MKFTQSIFAKLLLSFVLLSSLPLLLTGWLTYRNAEQELNNKLQRETINILDQKLLSLSLYIADMRRMGDAIATSPEITRFMLNGSEVGSSAIVGNRATTNTGTRSGSGSGAPSDLKSLLDRSLAAAHAIRPENIGITLINRHGQIHSYGYEPSEDLVNIQSSPWLPGPNSFRDGHRYVISVLHDRPYSRQDENRPVFSFIRMLDGGGLVVIDFGTELLRDLMKNIFLTGDIYSEYASGVIITDREEQLLYPYAAGYFGKEHYARLNNHYFLIQRNDKTTGWHFTAYFLKSELYKPIRTTRNMALTVTLASVLVCLAVSLILSRRISGPILHLRNLMSKVGSGNLDIQYNSSGKDEIGALGNGFNRMVHRIRDLVQQVYEEQNAKRRAEVTAMQSQINPHFLYNTLESINSLARKNKQPEISRMIVLLGKLLRMSISTFDDMITFGKELDYVRHYLEIHRYRQNQAYSYRIDMEPEILKLYTIKWILQPIIENTVIHGLEAGPPTDGSSSIEIKGWIEEDEIRISIRDHGTGIQEDRLIELQKDLELRAPELTKQGHKVGLYNVQSRIKLYFGEPYGMKIDNAEGSGTIVTLRLPRRESP